MSMRHGIDWTFRFAPETDNNPGPQYEAIVHNYRVFVYRRHADRTWQFSISVKHGRHAGKFLYRSSLDNNYKLLEDVHETIQRATDRITATTID